MGFTINSETYRMTITRGDSGRAKFTIKMDGEPYEMQEGDKVEFGVKKLYTDEECLIKKVMTENPCILRLDPADTAQLDFGTYRYDMQFVSAEGFTRTFLEKKKFKISEEVV